MLAVPLGVKADLMPSGVTQSRIHDGPGSTGNAKTQTAPGRPGLPRSDGYREPLTPAYSRRAGIASTRVLTTTVLAT
jgi:hypothetical protein